MISAVLAASQDSERLSLPRLAEKFIIFGVGGGGVFKLAHTIVEVEYDLRIVEYAIQPSPSAHPFALPPRLGRQQESGTGRVRSFCLGVWRNFRLWSGT